MKKAVIFLSAALTCVAATAEARLREGARAPDFTLEAARGGKEFRFSLAEALKKGPVVVYFYPKSFTSVCTEEAHLFADSMDEFAALGASVIGVSGDDVATQIKFSTMECRDKFPVAADAGLDVARSYDASFGGVFAARISYVVSPDGRIISSVADSGAQRHIGAALAAVRAWRAAHKN